MPRVFFHIVAAFIFLCFKSEEQKYEKIFANDYVQAVRFLKNNKSFILKSCSSKKTDAALLISTVFPELLRYSLLKDLMETSTLELLYVKQGPSVADFSIGAFQMKPSFAENLERIIARNDSLKVIYKCLLNYSAKSEAEIRAKRVKRLSMISWQVEYANAFLSVMELHFGNKTFSTKEEKIKFYAAAYNSGFYRKEKEIEASVSIKQFPYGKNYSGTQYSYSSIAGYFYTEHVTKLLTQDAIQQRP